MEKHNLLSDKEIRELSTNGTEDHLISPINNNNVNSSSYILRVGSVHKPSPTKPIKEIEERNSWVIKPGQMVVILTYEKVFLPKNLIGIVFGANSGKWDAGKKLSSIVWHVVARLGEKVGNEWPRGGVCRIVGSGTLVKN